MEIILAALAQQIVPIVGTVIAGLAAWGISILKEKTKADAAKNALDQVKEEPLMIDGRRCCLDCEEPISEKRLTANPDAVRCTPCQARKERNG